MKASGKPGKSSQYRRVRGGTRRATGADRPRGRCEQEGEEKKGGKTGRDKVKEKLTWKAGTQARR